MKLALLPPRIAGAAENMAVDFLLLQRYPEPGDARFRHYGWRLPSFTFGYSQKVAAVRALLPQDQPIDLCRRPTGGGIVDHRDDWTWSLVVPRGHPLEEARAAESYRQVHEEMAAALRAQGVPAATQAVRESAAVPLIADACFERAEVHDVVDSTTGAKIAGAAQKRNKQGLLMQGSILRGAVPAGLDWDLFHDAFAARLAAALDLPAERTPWPELDDDEVTALTERYSGPEWMAFR